ncbi:MAG: flavodoxin-dependent (E)-4-hydroxy-3-methylbut-2-enyl-diphosphate synthase [Candidatus Marinimicrobia bacterium]|nr:flavodoxin-dependent (E)-4-hydroxy-3-methylbut-2-enyl-diphosphate synthase [Candidatus Neomarinimicrobiota bacterium]
MKRKNTRKIYVADVLIGGKSPITIQSMTTSKTYDVESVVKEIKTLEAAGCQIIRASLPDMDSVKAIPQIKEQIDIPLIGDIHFNYKLALAAIDRGIDKIRINSGNIGSREKVENVLAKAQDFNIPIRIGVNSGSLEKDILEKYGHPTADAMLESAEKHLKICQEFGFQDLVFSLKSTNVPLMIEVNRKFSKKYSYPLHLGVTEAGTGWKAMVKSSLGIGTLLAEGIGDTIRVSLTDDPVEEIKAGLQILRTLGLAPGGLDIISCPTCARAQVNLVPLVKELEKRTEHIKKNLTVAVMGCAVNGPGEAREADIGIACGKNSGILFKKGEVIETIPEDEMIARLIEELENFPEK